MKALATIVAALAFTANAAQAQTTNKERLTGLVAYLALYTNFCNGKITEEATKNANYIIKMYGEPAVMALMLEYNEQREQIGNDKFCQIIRETAPTSIKQ